MGSSVKMHSLDGPVARQSTFAVITAAIITGSIAERMRFGPLLIFISIWHLLVYCPLCHWEWGGGFVSERERET